MRLNRENTYIENNLYPCAGLTPAECKAKFVAALQPYKEYVDQFQNALLLNNIPLFAVTIGAVVGFQLVYLLLNLLHVTKVAQFIITIPLLELLYCFDVHIHIKKLFQEIKDDSLLSLEQLMEYAWKPIKIIWILGFYVYRTFVCPNVVDTIIFIVVTIIITALNSLLHLNVIFGILLTIALCIPAILKTLNAQKADKKND